MGYLKDFIHSRQQRINEVLFTCLPSMDIEPIKLHHAMHYAVLNGGKRIRPLLTYAVGEAFGADPKILDIPASAVEIMHASSLVHDDLPSMDNDDFRRGKPTCHKTFNEATALLTGDALLLQAIDILCSCEQLNLESKNYIIKRLITASNSLGLIGGQSLDIAFAGTEVTKDQIEKMYA